MLLQIDHLTLYRYETPARGVVQSHRLLPSTCTGQQVLGWDVTVSGGLKGGGFRDGAGDWVQGWSVPGPVSEIAVQVRGQVSTTDMAGVLRGHRETIAPEVYLVQTQATALTGALPALAKAGQGEPTPLASAHALSRAVTQAVAYQPGTTHAHTTAAQALDLGVGVCQDHAHVLCAVARANQIPARYVSGYLSSDAQGMGHEAAHAWAELYIAGLGWVGFDPANACCPDARYVRLASGLDSRDAAPIRGSARSTGAEWLEVTVAVQAMQQ